MIANLLMMVVKKTIKKQKGIDLCFSNMMTVTRHMLSYYIDLKKLLINPENAFEEEVSEIFDPQLKFDFIIRDLG